MWIVNASVARAASLSKTVFPNVDDDRSAVTGPVLNSICKDWNSFQQAVDTQHGFSKEIDLQAQLGSTMFPEYPSRSLSQAFYELTKAF